MKKLLGLIVLGGLCSCVYAERCGCSRPRPARPAASRPAAARPATAAAVKNDVRACGCQANKPVEVKPEAIKCGCQANKPVKVEEKK